MMKQSKIKLDVDFIGGQEPLTKDEEKAISDYLKTKNRKVKSVLDVRLPVARRKKHVA